MGRKKPVVGAAVDELQGVDIGDARLDARVYKMVAALERNPAAAFPVALRTEAELEGGYRLLNNAAVTLDELLAPHAAATCRRIEEFGGRPIIDIDKTAAVFPGEADREGLTRTGKSRHQLDFFVALAVTSERRPLGVLAIRPLGKANGRSDAKEWALTVDAVAAHDLKDPIFVMDREADSYELFAHLGDDRRDFVIRVAKDRWIQEYEGASKEMLSELASRAPKILTREVKLARRTAVGRAPDARRRHPPREGRPATLSVRTCQVTLPKPRKLRGSLPATLTVNLVHVIEENPPMGVEAVEWLLFTTLPIDEPATVESALDTYRARWTIEEYFKALKSGCSYEKRQLESRHALLNALGLLAPLAWRLLALRSAKDDSKIPASAYLEPDEIYVLRKLSTDVKLGRAPNAHDAFYALARLGGHIPNNGQPGWLVIWRGVQHLLASVEGYRLARGRM